MKTWVKVLVGIAVGFLALLALALVLLVRSGKWDQVQRMAGGISRMKHGAEDLERFQREHAFTPPADGLIQEQRLATYLEICESLQPFVQPYQAWMEAHAGKQGDFKDAVEALELMGKVTLQAAETCRAKGMTPRELAWLHRSVRKAMEEAQAKGIPPDRLDLVEVLRRAAVDPGLSKALKGEIQRKLQRYEARDTASKEPLSANAQLCRIHAERIRRADLGDFATMILEGTAKGKRRNKD